jgi:hypothetical protein
MENAELITQQWGAFGAVFLLVLAPLAGFAFHQTRELAKSRKEHIEDSKAVSGTVIAVIKDFSEAAREQVRSQAETRAVSENMIEALARVETRISSLEAIVGKSVSTGGYGRSR